MSILVLSILFRRTIAHIVSVLFTIALIFVIWFALIVSHGYSEWRAKNPAYIPDGYEWIDCSKMTREFLDRIAETRYRCASPMRPAP